MDQDSAWRELELKSRSRAALPAASVPFYTVVPRPPASAGLHEDACMAGHARLISRASSLPPRLAALLHRIACIQGPPERTRSTREKRPAMHGSIAAADVAPGPLRRARLATPVPALVGFVRTRGLTSQERCRRRHVRPSGSLLFSSLLPPRRTVRTALVSSLTCLRVALIGRVGSGGVGPSGLRPYHVIIVQK